MFFFAAVMSADARYVHPLQSTSNVYFSRAWNAASSVEEPERRSALLTALSQLATEQRWFVPLLGSGAPLEFNEFASRHNQRLAALLARPRRERSRSPAWVRNLPPSPQTPPEEYVGGCKLSFYFIFYLFFGFVKNVFLLCNSMRRQDGFRL